MRNMLGCLLWEDIFDEQFCLVDKLLNLAYVFGRLVDGLRVVRIIIKFNDHGYLLMKFVLLQIFLDIDP